MPVNMRAVGNADLDIFCLIKLNMSDRSLCQTPLLVYPGAMLSEVERFLNGVNRTTDIITPQLEPGRYEEIQELADALEADYPYMSRAVAFYRRQLNPTDLQGYTKLNFLSGANASTRWCQINLGERPLPPKPHHLQVVFHRSRG